ncbi:MAG: polyribonucleotide nucleotidyltransferase, partial [Pseudomonadota bacterium]
TKDDILMVECGATEIPEDVMVVALELGHKSIQPIIDLQIKMQAEIGKPKREVILTTANEELQKKVFESVSANMNELLDKPLSKGEFYGGMDELQAVVVAKFCIEGDTNAPKTADVKSAFSEAEHKIVRERILSMGKRPDGRTPHRNSPDLVRSGTFPARARYRSFYTRRDPSLILCDTRHPG